MAQHDARRRGAVSRTAAMKSALRMVSVSARASRA